MEEYEKSPLDEVELLSEMKKKWKEADDGLSEWITEARESYAFVAGDQWSEEDSRILREQDRPPVTFNRIGAMIDAISGIEVNNRQEIKYYPRTIEDTRPNEILTAAVKWIRDCSNAEDEESDSFRDAAICGIGVTDTRMDYDNNPDGMVVISREDPILARWWPGAKKKCLVDSHYRFLGRWVDKEEAEMMWPDKEIISKDDEFEEMTPGDGEQSFRYDGDLQGANDKTRNKVFLRKYECYKLEPFYRVLDPFQQKLVSLSEEDFKKLQKNSEQLGLVFSEQSSAKQGEIPYVKQKKKVYYRGFYTGDTLLEYKKSPVQEFTIKFITAKRDRNKNVWYGPVRSLKDPQRWGNKFLSQILHIINTNAKGGAFVEENALLEPKKAEEQWGAANPLIKLTEGGIGKIKERSVAQYPNGLDRLMMFAFESLPLVSGLPLELMGTTNREQAGVLEEQRKKAAIAVLSGLFASLRSYRKDQGRLLLKFVQQFMSDNRLMRVTGNKGDAQYMPLVKQDDTIEYDVIVDEAPYSIDFKERVWNALSQSVLPALIKQGIPVPASLYAYSPLPQDVANEVAQAQQGQLPPQVQQKFQQMQQQLQQLGQELQKTKEENLQLRVDSSIDMAKAQMNYEGKILSIQQKEASSQRDGGIEQARLMLEAREAQINERIALLNAEMEKFRAAMEVQSKSVEQQNKQIDQQMKVIELVKSMKETDKEEKKESEPKNINITVQNKSGRKKAKKVNGEWIVEDA